jgi:hypothetical protein
VENVAFFAFLFASVVGAFMAYLHFTGGERSLPSAIVHGVLVASGIIFLTVGLAKDDAGEGAAWMIGLFVAVGLGGAYLLLRHLRREPWPNAVVLAHGGAALAALVVLAVWLFG